MAKKDIFGNMKVKGSDIFFQPEYTDTDEKIREIPLEKLFAYRNHPYSVKDDREMEDLVESIRENGVQTPALVRPLPHGGYEILSGHRRHRASTLAGKDTMPCIVREIDDDTAAICMVDANLQRENISAVEKAAAYKIKLEALRNQGKAPAVAQIEPNAEKPLELQEKTAIFSSENEQKIPVSNDSKNTYEKLAEGTGDSVAQVKRYLRINELVPELKELVDEGRIAVNAAVPISYLEPKEQQLLAGVLSDGSALTIEQAQSIKVKAEKKKTGTLTENEIMRAMDKTVRPEQRKAKRSLLLDDKYLKQFFDDDISIDDIKEIITQLLTNRE